MGNQEAINEVLCTVAWCEAQVNEIMGITAGCATTHGDPGGGLEMANRCASDIAINLALIAKRLEPQEGNSAVIAS